MKNLKVYIATVALAFSFFPVSLNADTGKNVKTTDPITTNAQIRSELLINRLEEIKYMDKSDMNRSERKELRKEIREASKELKALGGGVYISVGAILLVAVLLILFL